MIKLLDLKCLNPDEQNQWTNEKRDRIIWDLDEGSAIFILQNSFFPTHLLVASWPVGFSCFPASAQLITDIWLTGFFIIGLKTLSADLGIKM